MRQPEVCKHQVCDHCGGRFGMVTHRWWGDKFCKRTCKNTYLRENHHTLSGWFIPRVFTFAGGACLAAVVAVAMLTLLLASANAAPGEERPVVGSSLEFIREDGIEVPDREIWTIVAFVKKLPSVSDDDFKAWTAKP